MVECLYRMTHGTFVKIVYPAKAEKVPVLIFMSGANCPHDCYGWLATALAEKGLAVVLSSSVGDGGYLLSLPYDVKQLESLESYKDPGPAAVGLMGLLAELKTVPFLDLDNLVLGGHSMGGRAALDTIAFGCDFVKLAFTYGTSVVNSGGPPGKNWFAEKGTVIPFDTTRGKAVPLILLHGDADGVSAQLSKTKNSTETAKRTFYEAAGPNTHIIILKNCNHMLLAHPSPSPPCQAEAIDTKMDENIAAHRRQIIIHIILAALRENKILPSEEEASLKARLQDKDIQDSIAFHDYK